MQERGMRRIDADLERLQPVAIDVALECEGMAIGRHEAIDFRKRRRLAFAEIRPQNSALLDHRVSALRNVLAQRGIPGLGGCFKALARHVEQPAVERAPQAAIFETAKREVGAAMRAMALDQAVTSLLIAKQHQALAQQFEGLDRPRTLQLIDERCRLPVHPHQFPARIRTPRPGHQVVLFLAHHGGVSLVTIDRGIEYPFKIKLLGLRFRASGFLAQICLVTRHGACEVAQFMDRARVRNSRVLRSCRCRQYYENARGLSWDGQPTFVARLDRHDHGKYNGHRRHRRRRFYILSSHRIPADQFCLWLVGNTMDVRHVAFAFALFGVLVGSGPVSAEDHFPGAEWDHAVPAELGWSEAGLARARAFSDEIRSSAVMIIQHGKVVAEWGNTTKRTELASVRKSLLSSLIGVAV